MKSFINKNVLITTSAWFYAPDGKQYCAVWGNLTAIHEAGKTLGFIPNRAHANWFVEIGNMVIMGCQVMYIIQFDERPFTGMVERMELGPDKAVVKFELPAAIYIA